MSSDKVEKGHPTRQRACRLHRGAIHLARESGTPDDRRRRRVRPDHAGPGRPANHYHGSRELSRISRRNYGARVMVRMRDQVARFGTRFVEDMATKVDLSERPFKVWVNDDLYGLTY